MIFKIQNFAGSISQKHYLADLLFSKKKMQVVGVFLYFGAEQNYLPETETGGINKSLCFDVWLKSIFHIWANIFGSKSIIVNQKRCPWYPKLLLRISLLSRNMQTFGQELLIWWDIYCGLTTFQTGTKLYQPKIYFKNNFIFKVVIFHVDRPFVPYKGIMKSFFPRRNSTQLWTTTMTTFLKLGS